jgi:lipoyl synthase
MMWSRHGSPIFDGTRLSDNLFMKNIRLCVPDLTRTVSVTGSACALSCAHCARHYLGFMETPEEVMARGVRRYRSALVSGGMNGGGWVPLEEHLEFLKLLHSWHWRLNFHVGLMPESSLSLIKGLATKISFDLVLDSKTIDEVYGLNAAGNDYIRVYESLKRDFSVVPHITVGILGGQVRGELEIIDFLSDHKPDEVVFLIFRPTRGTLYGTRNPPAPHDVERVFRHARKILPDASFSLGCMRPRGKEGYVYERSAMECGFTTFVLPGREFRASLDTEHYAIEEIRECCVL